MQQHAPWIGAALASLLATAAFAATVPAPAVQNPQRHRTEATGPDITKLGGAEGWDAFSDAVKGHKICYLIGKPTKSEPANAKRGPIYASVTHRPSEKRTNEVSFTVGYLFKEGSDAELTVDGKKFSLFTNKEGAWTQDAATDKAVVEALAKGKQAVIKGTSVRGTQTTDTYSLIGFSQALAQIDKACGVKR